MAEELRGVALDLELARGEAKRKVWAAVSVCRGATKGCPPRRPAPCGECYVVRADDPRSTEQIIADMERGSA